jgi:hypothetical protein
MDKQIFDTISSFGLYNINNSIKLQYPITGISNGINIQVFIDFSKLDFDTFDTIYVYDFDKLNNIIRTFDFNIETNEDNFLELTKDSKKSKYILSNEKTVIDDSDYDLHKTLNSIDSYFEFDISKEDIDKLKKSILLFNEDIKIDKDSIKVGNFKLNYSITTKAETDLSSVLKIDYTDFLKIPTTDYVFKIFKNANDYILLLKHEHLDIILPLKQ